MAFGPSNLKDCYIDILQHPFIVQSYKKVIVARIQFWTKHKKEHEGEPVIDEQQHSRRYNVVKKGLDEGIPVPSPGVFDKVNHLIPADHRIRTVTFEDDSKEMYKEIIAREPHILDIMYPVLPEHDQILHGGTCRFSLRGEGKCEYLRVRNGEVYEPAFKYRNPTLTSFEYGWDSKSSHLDLVKSKFLKKSQLKNELPGTRKKTVLP